MVPPTVCIVEISDDSSPPQVLDFRARKERTYGELYANAFEVIEGRRIIALQDADEGMVFGRGLSIHINQGSFFLGADFRNMAIEKPNVRILVSRPVSPSPPASPARLETIPA